MENDKTIGWISAMENGSPALDELIEAHSEDLKYFENRTHINAVLVDHRQISGRC